MSQIGERYRALVAAGELRPDADQERAVAALDRLAEALAARQGVGLFTRLFGKAGAPPGGLTSMAGWGGANRW